MPALLTSWLCVFLHSEFALQGLVLFSRLGVYIPLPGVDVGAFASSIKTEGLLGYIDTLSGGSISRVGIFSLGESSATCLTYTVSVQLASCARLRACACRHRALHQCVHRPAAAVYILPFA